MRAEYQKDDIVTGSINNKFKKRKQVEKICDQITKTTFSNINYSNNIYLFAVSYFDNQKAM